MQKTAEKARASENLPRRVLARVLAEELQQVQCGNVQMLTIVQTGGAVRDLSDSYTETDFSMG